MTGFQSLEEFVECAPVTSRTATTAVDAADTPVYPFGVVSGCVRPASQLLPSIAVVDANTLSIPAGNGYIASGTGNVTPVAWAAQEYSVSFLNDAWVMTIAINTAGGVVALEGIAAPAYARTHIILGTVTRIGDGVGGLTAMASPHEWKADAYAAFDYVYSNNGQVFEGGGISPSASSRMGLDIAERVVYHYGRAPNTDSPNIVTQAQQSKVNLYIVTGSGDFIDCSRSVPVGVYNPDGGHEVADMDDQVHATIHRIYELTGRTILLLGQTEYATFGDAVAAVETDAFTVPVQLHGADLLGYVVVSGAAVSLKNPLTSLVLSTDVASPSSSSGGGTAITQTGGHNLFPDPNFEAPLVWEQGYGEAPEEGVDYDIVDLDTVFGVGQHPLPQGTRGIRFNLQHPAANNTALVCQAALSSAAFAKSRSDFFKTSYWVYSSAADEGARVGTVGFTHNNEGAHEDVLFTDPLTYANVGWQWRGDFCPPVNIHEDQRPYPVTLGVVCRSFQQNSFIIIAAPVIAHTPPEEAHLFVYEREFADFIQGMRTWDAAAYINSLPD